MRIEFYNVPVHPSDCNTAIFKMKSGDTIAVDRDTTEHDKNADGTYNMRWRNIYLWAINDQRIFSEPAYLYDARSFFEEVKFISFELDDECEDIDYDLSGVEFSV
nr:MAG TPA: hypothetical protein [Caudoviricetes sp.]